MSVLMRTARQDKLSMDMHTTSTMRGLTDLRSNPSLRPAVTLGAAVKEPDGDITIKPRDIQVTTSQIAGGFKTYLASPKSATLKLILPSCSTYSTLAGFRSLRVDRCVSSSIRTAVTSLYLGEIALSDQISVGPARGRPTCG
jgi:hypothetical protein